MMLAEFNPSAWIEIGGLIFATLLLLAITAMVFMGKTVPKIMYPLVLVAFIALGVVPSVIKFKDFQGEFEQKDKTISEVQSAADAANHELIVARESLGAAQLESRTSSEGETKWRMTANDLQAQLTTAQGQTTLLRTELTAAHAEFRELRLAGPKASRTRQDPVPTSFKKEPTSLKPEPIWSSWTNKDQEYRIADIGVAVTVVKFHWDGWVTGNTKSYGKAVTIKLTLPGSEPSTRVVGERHEAQFGIGQVDYQLIVDQIRGKDSGQPQARLSLRKILKPGP